VVAGSAALVYSIPIASLIAVLIAVVVSSYRQTILAYPLGGGSYIVTKDNLGQVSGLVSAGRAAHRLRAHGGGERGRGRGRHHLRVPRPLRLPHPARRALHRGHRDHETCAA